MSTGRPPSPRPATWRPGGPRGTWLFIVGSVELLVRPVIRIGRLWHLQRLPAPSGGPGEADADF